MPQDHQRPVNDALNSFVPVARKEAIQSTESGEEVLLYDEDVHHIHHLKGTAAPVWRLADGKRTVREIADYATLSDIEVLWALQKIDEVKLLSTPVPDGLRIARPNRRRFLQGALGASLPVIVSITAPMAAAAASPAGCSVNPGQYGCNTTSDCCLRSGYRITCVDGFCVFDSI
jgi:hypothetical protein